MKTVWIDARAYRQLATNKSGKIQKISNADYTNFVNQVPSFKRETQLLIQPMLNRGGFIYAPVLWKWSIKREPYNISLWLRLSFEDTNNDGKTKFMDKIKKTGILNHSTIVKSYG